MHSDNKTIQGPFTPKIAVIGVGGAGGNAVNNMITSKLDGVSFIAVNTDAQALENSLAPTVLRLGSDSTGGLGAGARPEIGRAAAEESLDEVLEHLEGQNMVFITAGMGGGTGTGAAPVIAEACKERGILTVGVVTKPFQFEGAQRMRLADAGIEELAANVDTLIVIPNQNLFRIANEKTTFADAFRLADEVLQSGVRGVTDLMVVPGMINLDFADVRSAISEMGKAMMGTGEATGERRAIEAAEQAINNPLLDDVSMKGARSVIINITGGHDITLFEIEEACNRINDEVDPDATIIFGSTYDDSLEGTMRITVVATGIEAEMNRRAATSRGNRFGVSARPSTQQQSTPVTEETAPAVDSFVARYPEPSRVDSQGQGGVSAPATAPSHTQAQPVTQPVSMPQPQQQEVAYVPDVAVASLPQQHAEVGSAPVIQEQQQSQSVEMGATANHFVNEGNVVRKVEARETQYDASAYSHIIPQNIPADYEESAPASSLNLTPPKRPIVQQEQRKTPSLFERITGRKRDDATDEESETISSSSTGNFGSMGTNLSAEKKTVVTAYDEPKTVGEQGTLNIDAPKPTIKKSSGPSAEDLDIPAFLRRQIS